ncbi:hypothetical protein H310_00427 [Aphanomyces invadans]|uniref:Uncharacterized protein n=1 Tax=Aphanomyces invadans TaxID=157072 RepID=A0A024UVS3_9STRA|nr:hypothetical protein H310_00427 [Aphanomyces invadans]ETW10027.1 hypothetical protein H310_00427 [Aphanomyces invadans]|eukprot:XP_008861438.1 hypothetical protein H310_00427 [Aphanomyces invadans]
MYCSSLAYAIIAPFTGQVTDRIEGRIGLLVAYVMSGLCNLTLGMLFVTNTFTHVSVMALNVLKVLSQGFGASECRREDQCAEILPGVFNILVSSGYYLAFGSGYSIIEGFEWPFLFFIPTARLAVTTVMYCDHAV